MFVVPGDRALVTTITGSLPRPAWLTAALGSRPFSVAMAGPRFSAIAGE